MRYPVAVWNTNGVYSAEVPDLPGAITEADSIEELERIGEKMSLIRDISFLILLLSIRHLYMTGTICVKSTVNLGLLKLSIC